MKNIGLLQRSMYFSRGGRRCGWGAFTTPCPHLEEGRQRQRVEVFVAWMATSTLLQTNGDCQHRRLHANNANSTSARTSIRLSSRIHAPHITRRWNTQWDLTSTAVPAGSAPAASTLSKQQMQILAPPAVASKPSIRPLHGHQSASALGSMHHTSRAAGIRSGISPPLLCLPDPRQP
eukprot:COSAG02_NODE_13310_length_1411_cov_11.904726_1_plen_176_part_10